MIDVLLICMYVIVGTIITYLIIPSLFYLCVKMGILAIHKTKKEIKEKENQNEQEKRTNRET